MAHFSLFYFALAGSSATRAPLGVLVERYGMPGGVAPALSEVELLTVDVPSDVSVAPAKVAKKKSAHVPPASVEPGSDAAAEGGGRLGNAAVGNESGVLGDPNGVAVSARERYLYELKLFLEQRKIYPAVARALGQTGTVALSFVVDPEGVISDTEIVAPSPHARLNQAALELVRSAARFKPFPETIGRQAWHLTVPIRYELN